MRRAARDLVVHRRDDAGTAVQADQPVAIEGEGRRVAVQAGHEGRRRVSRLGAHAAGKFWREQREAARLRVFARLRALRPDRGEAGAWRHPGQQIDDVRLQFAHRGSSFAADCSAVNAPAKGGRAFRLARAPSPAPARPFRRSVRASAG